MSSARRRIGEDTDDEETPCGAAWTRPGGNHGAHCCDRGHGNRDVPRGQRLDGALGAAETDGRGTAADDGSASPRCTGSGTAESGADRADAVPDGSDAG